MRAPGQAARAALVFTGAAGLALLLGDPVDAGALAVMAAVTGALAAWERHRQRARARRQALRERYARAVARWPGEPRLTALTRAEEQLLTGPHEDPQMLRKLMGAAPSIGGREQIR